MPISNQHLEYITKNNIKQENGLPVLLLLLLVIFHVSSASNFTIDINNNYEQKKIKNHLPTSSSKMGCFSQCAICLDGVECAGIGKDILLRNGSAVDAMIAVLICNGMVNMQSMGIGGGFFMLIYKKDENNVYSVNAREVAPMKASNELYQQNPNGTAQGILSVAVPGELKGYYEAHKKFGKLPWKELVQPTVELCEKGYCMTNHQSMSLNRAIANLENDENLREWFYDSKGVMKKPGSRIVPTKFCKTLKIIAKNGPNDFYSGEISKMLLQDFRDAGGIITEEDLQNYQIEWNEPYEIKVDSGHKIFSAPPPASGPILGFIMNILSGYNFKKADIAEVNKTITTYHRIIEAFKFGYAKRSELGDPRFIKMKKLLKDLTSKEHAREIRKKIKDKVTFTEPSHYGGDFFSVPTNHGTSHLTLIAPNGDAVTVTSSINIYFGAGLTSKRTGIILNSHMDDFSYPWKINYFGLRGSPHNRMEPGKRPLSSMSPCIVLDKNNDLKIVVGAAGGSQITTSVALILMRILWFGDNIKEAIDAPRFHHQLLPMKVFYECGIRQQVVDGLKKLGHTMKTGIKSNVYGLLKERNFIYGSVDNRKGGNVLGFF